MLTGKNILVGLSGGIAAYKIPTLIRLLVKQNANVKVVATKNSLEFVTELTLQTLSKNKVYTDMFGAVNEYSTEHISLTDWADILIIAPATANIIGKMANGIADDALSTTCMAFDKTTFIAPSMNVKMYANPALQDNLNKLKSRGVVCIEPSEGELACGYDGKGRMEEPEIICRFVNDFLGQNQKLSKKKALVTAGPTYEAIDPVRYIGNHSSGLMGIEIAEELARQGAEVTLICGPSNITVKNPNIKRIDVISADDMYKYSVNHFKDADIAVLAAAVSDYKPKTKAEQKIKKKTDELTIELTKTPDILAELGKQKRKGQILVGFALETENELEHAKQKLNKKNLDFIVLNSLNDKGAGFKSPTNKIHILKADGSVLDFDLKSKAEVARDIVWEIVRFTEI